MRKPIQITASQSSHPQGQHEANWNLFALCDDGTIWSNRLVSDEWLRLADIPQDKVDEAMARLGRAEGDASFWQREAERTLAELNLAYESIGAQVEDWKASAMRHKAEVERLREALRFYADKKAWAVCLTPPYRTWKIVDDHGEIARKALEGK